MNTRLFLLTAFLLALLAPGRAQEIRRTEVIYGRKFGTALTLDVLQPAKTNGYGMIWVVSGGFYSDHNGVNPAYYKELLDRGYTVFAVVHGSQPRFTLLQLAADLHRSVRWVRPHAADYGIRPDRIGVSGASAGGPLSLTLGTQGRDGDPKATDPVDRESSAVQVVACFFPPTDYLNWGEPGDDAVGVGRLTNFKPAFGPRSDTREGRETLGREISPLNFVTAKTAPTLIIHGDADGLVPIYQARLFEKKAKEAGVPFKLVVREGKDHGWPGIEKDLVQFADWYKAHLK